MRNYALTGSDALSSEIYLLHSEGSYVLQTLATCKTYGEVDQLDYLRMLSVLYQLNNLFSGIFVSHYGEALEPVR
jgi:hypothetical protein